MVGGHCETNAGIIRTIFDFRKFKEEEKAFGKADYMLRL